MNKIFITLDYELFFGTNTGTQFNSVIYPTERLLKVLDKNNIKASFFVDSGYLLKLKEFKNKFPALEKDYEEISEQLRRLSLEGHDIQLHIHPHWEDSYYNGKMWVINTSRYRLHSFSKEEISSIVFRYKKILEEHTQNEIFVFRAGGWCIQPFNKLKEALKINSIWVDSTVFENGRNKTETHFFNFKGAPEKSLWKFEDDPLIENSDGFFTQIPISSIKVSPFFFWRLAWFKKSGGAFHESFGDGISTKGSILEKIRMLTKFSSTVISIDGYKSSLLKGAYKKNKRNKKNFVIIGHPKAFSEYSLLQLNKFIKQKETLFTTYSQWKKNK